MYNRQQQDFPSRSSDRVLGDQPPPQSALYPPHARQGTTITMNSQRRSHPVPNVLMAPPHTGSFGKCSRKTHMLGCRCAADILSFLPLSMPPRLCYCYRSCGLNCTCWGHSHLNAPNLCFIVSAPRHPKDTSEHVMQQHNPLKSSRDQTDNQILSVNQTPSIHATGHPPQFTHPPSQTEATTANSHRIFASTPSIRPQTAQPSHNRLQPVTNFPQARFRPVSGTPARGRATDM